MRLQQVLNPGDVAGGACDGCNHFVGVEGRGQVFVKGQCDGLARLPAAAADISVFAGGIITLVGLDGGEVVHLARGLRTSAGNR